MDFDHCITKVRRRFLAELLHNLQHDHNLVPDILAVAFTESVWRQGDWYVMIGQTANTAFCGQAVCRRRSRYVFWTEYVWEPSVIAPIDTVTAQSVLGFDWDMLTRGPEFDLATIMSDSGIIGLFYYCDGMWKSFDSEPYRATPAPSVGAVSEGIEALVRATLK